MGTVVRNLILILNQKHPALGNHTTQFNIEHLFSYSFPWNMYFVSV